VDDPSVEMVAPSPTVPLAVEVAVPPPPPASPHRPGVLLVVQLGVLSALGPFSTDTYIPGLPSVVAHLHGTQTQGQLTVVAFIIGLAVGQVVVGPLSDAAGRRVPLMLGMLGYVLTSLACALAPNLPVLIASRLLQGLAASAGVVIARAIVRDVATGGAAASLFGRLMLIGGLAPIFAPVIGATVLRLTDWRGLFVGLALLGALTLLAAVRMPETLPRERRRRGGLRTVAKDVGVLRRDRRVIGYALTFAFAFTAMFGFIASAAFILENHFKLTPTGFGVAFGLAALGFICGAQTGGRVARRLGSPRVVGIGCALLVVGAALMDIAVAADLPLVVFMTSVLLLFGSVGTLMPNALSAALAGHGDRAGSASAAMGTTQFILAGSIAPLAGIGGVDTRSVAILVTGATILCVVSFLVLAWPVERRAEVSS
jgi:MFS transporter, DHA1 family, multidrug resistance protein